MFEKELNINNQEFKISNNTILFFQESITNFDITLFVVNLSNIEGKNNNFETFYSFSLDKINYSNFELRENFEIPDLIIDSPVFIAVQFRQKISTDLDKPLTLYQQNNINTQYSELSYVYVSSIQYGDPVILYDLTLESIVKYQLFFDIINKYPKWNFYDGQIVTINRWLDQCESIIEMYGHTCIYFKTIPTETNNTLSTNINREVCNIKKLHIMFPGNTLPQDRNIYSDWDMPLQDEIVIHVVKRRFEQAFGNVIPVEKDYIYLPLLNKFFRISGSQPKNSFMGKIGWWEVYLSKWEDDESIGINSNLKSAFEGIPEFYNAMNFSTKEFEDENNQDYTNELLTDDTADLQSEILTEFENIKNDTLNNVEKLNLKTVEEKKAVNQNYTNKLVDSNFYVSLKETDKLREFYDRRLKIISVNPDSQSFPLTMYDNTTVDKRNIALQYNLNEYTTKNKFNQIVSKNLKLSFNFILINNFVGEIFDILSADGILSIFTIKLNRNKLEIIDNRSMDIFQVDYIFKPKEIFNVIFDYDFVLKQISIKIFGLANKEKTIEYQNIYISTIVTQNTFNLTHLHLFGGNFYSNEIILNINDLTILKDYVNPLLQMKSF